MAGEPMAGEIFFGKRYSQLSHFVLFLLCFPASIHISNCVGILYDLPLQPNNTASERFV